MKHSESIAHISPAFVAICGALSNPKRNRTVIVRPKSRPSYEFQYTTLDAILDLIRPVLAKHKCGLTQIITKSDENVPVLETRLVHESGEWFASEVDLVLNRDNPQAVGSSLTYYKRYAICGLLPIAGLEDDGGAVAEGQTLVEQPKGLMTGKELSDKFVSEFWNRDSYTVPVREGNVDQWRGWIEKLLKAAPHETTVNQIWADNDETFNALDPAAFNRLKKIRAERLEKLNAPDTSEEKPDAVD